MDVDVKLTISLNPNNHLTPEQQCCEIEYAINTACSRIEEIKGDVMYKMLVNGKPWRNPEIP